MAYIFDRSSTTKGSYLIYKMSSDYTITEAKAASGYFFTAFLGEKSGKQSIFIDDTHPYNLGGILVNKFDPADPTRLDPTERFNKVNFFQYELSTPGNY